MNTRRPYLLFALFGASACSSGTDPAQTVAEVRVSPQSPAVDVGLTVQFSAAAFDASGQPVTGLEVSWASSRPTVASVDGGGLVTAVAVGTSAITATIGGVSDSEVLIVEPSQCVGRVEVVLNGGEFQAYPGDTCLLLPSGQSGDRYRVAVVRPTLIEDPADAPNVTLEINPILATAAAAEAYAQAPPPTRSDAGPQLSAGLADAVKIDGTPFLEDARRRAATRAYHYELRRREMELGFERMAVLESGPQLAPPALVDPPGRLDLFMDRDCSTTDTTPVILIGFNDDVAVYQDSLEWDTTPLPANAYGYYSSHTKSMIDDYWGAPPDLDGNGRLIVTTTSTLPEEAVAAAWSGDFLDATGCAGSNQAEVIYYSGDILQNLVDPDQPSYFALSVLAHEVKHVSSLYHSLVRGRFHETWIEEGTAEISQVMSSRIAFASAGGTPIGSEITGQDIVNGAGPGGAVTAEMWGLVGEIAALIVTMTTHPNSLIVDPDAADLHSFRALSWQFHRLIGDAWGNASTPFGDASLFKALTDSLSSAGPAGLMEQTGRSFDQLYEDLIVAISTHKTGQTAAREFSTWDLVSATQIFPDDSGELSPEGAYPWPVTRSGSNNNAGFVAATYEGAIGPSGMRFHDFVSSGIGAGAQILVTGAESGKIIVTRLR
jgi:hypothetical protein